VCDKMVTIKEKNVGRGKKGTKKGIQKKRELYENKIENYAKWKIIKKEE
jgi:hypothetical protein